MSKDEKAGQKVQRLPEWSRLGARKSYFDNSQILSSKPSTLHRWNQGEFVEDAWNNFVVLRRDFFGVWSMGKFGVICASLLTLVFAIGFIFFWARKKRSSLTSSS